MLILDMRFPTSINFLVVQFFRNNKLRNNFRNNKVETVALNSKAVGSVDEIVKVQD